MRPFIGPSVRDRFAPLPHPSYVVRVAAEKVSKTPKRIRLKTDSMLGTSLVILLGTQEGSMAHELESGVGVQLLHIFISSPGDLRSEREVVKAVIDDLNQSPYFMNRIKLIPYAYEDSVPAEIGREPQVIVDNYLLAPDQASIFICMLWLRMGTPTIGLDDPATKLPYRSGTEYEFMKAYRGNQDQGSPLMLLYRCTRNAEDITALDVDQFSQVQQFFERLRGGGDLRGLFGQFADENVFRSMLRRDLEHLIVSSIGDSGIKPPPSAQPIYYIPTRLPPGYIERTASLDTLRKALLGTSDSVGIVAASTDSTAVHGPGGIGKTVLARAACDDPAIKAAFPDGILWATLGEAPDLIRHQRNWIGALGGIEATASSIESGRVELLRLLQNRAMLLVLDDIWNADVMQWLDVGGPNCRTLSTTRDIAQVEGAELVTLQLMEENESRELLREASKGKVADAALADDIAKRLGHLPLAIRIAGLMLRGRVTWHDIEAALDEGDIKFVEYGQKSILSTIDASVSKLSPDEQARYRELVIFPRDEAMVEEVVIRLWGSTAAYSPRRSRKLLDMLRDRALIQPDNHLHDLHIDYLHAVVTSDEEQNLHRMLAETYGFPPHTAQFPANDDHYAWRRYGYHLAQGGDFERLHELLVNGEYMQGKIARLGTAALLDDFALLDNDKPLQQIAGALRLSIHVLDRNPREIRNQLFGRLGDVSLLHNMPESTSTYFELESQSLIAPDGPLIRTFEERNSQLNACAISPQGTFCVSGGDNGILRLWNVATGESVGTFQGHEGWISACVFDPTGEHILSAGQDGTLRLWDVKTRQQVRMFRGHRDWVRCCAFNSTGEFAVSGSDDSTLCLWEVSTGQPLLRYEGHLGWIRGCAFSADDNYIVSASEDATLRLWDVWSMQTLQEFKGHSDSVRACAFSADGRTVLSASDDWTLRLWDLKSGRALRILRGHRRPIYSCAVSADGRFALSASDDHTVRYWDLSLWDAPDILKGHTNSVTSCAFAMTGDRALSAGLDGSIKLWDLTRTRQTNVHEVSDGAVTCAQMGSDGNRLVTGSRDGSVRLWNTETMRVERILQDREGWVNDCAISPDGATLLTAFRDTSRSFGALDSRYRLDADTRASLQAIQSGILELWDLGDGNKLRSSFCHDDWVRACAYSRDGQLIASASDDRTIRIWNANLEHQTILQGHVGWVTDCAFSPDGSWLLSSSHDGTLRMWNVLTGECERVLKGHTNWVLCCDFDQSGRFAVSGSKDTTISIWDVITGQRVCTLVGHNGSVSQCLYTCNPNLVVSVSFDRTMRLWSVPQEREVARWVTDTGLTCCSCHPDGQRYVVGDEFGQTHFLRLIGAP